MALTLAAFTSSNPKDINPNFETVGEFQVASPVRFGVVLYVKDLGTASGDITVRVELLDASTSFLYGFFDKAVTKASGNLDMATVVDPGFQLFLPVNVKAQIKIKSDQPSDSAVTWDGWAYDVNFATAAAEARLTATPTIPTAAYEVNDTVGAQMSFVVGASRGTVVGARLLDKAKQSKPFEIWLFRASISTPSDASAFNPSATDLEKLVGVLRVNDWFDANANSIGQAENLPLAFAGLSGTTLYGWLVTRGTPDYVNSTDLIVELDVLKE